MVTSDWNKEFEIMCDASDYAMGAVLGQRRYSRPYTMLAKPSMKLKRTTLQLKKKMLAMVFACEKLRTYIFWS